MIMVTMPSSKVVSFFVLTVVSMSHTVISSEMTNDTTPQYAVTELTAAEHLTFQWTLKNYSLLSPGESGCFRSPYFHTKSDDVQWLLKSCLREDFNSYTETIKLMSHSPEGLDNIAFLIEGQISIFKADNILGNQTFSKKVRIGEELQFSFTGYVSETPHWDDYADEMTIRCDFDVKRTITKRIDVTESLKQKIVQEPQKGKLNDDFSRFLKREKFSDVDIVVGDEKLPAHKIILATRCPGFARVLDKMQPNNSKEMIQGFCNKSEIIMQGIGMKAAVIKAMLEYVYTHDVTNLDEFPFMFELLSAAHEYELPQLRIMCERVLPKRLNVDSAADILIYADRYGLYKLKEHVMQFITDNFHEVAKTKGYKKMWKESFPLLAEIIVLVNDKHF